MPKRPHNTLGRRLLFRELNGNRGIGSVAGLYGARKLVEDLDIIGELGGHTGCINALQWSRDGSLLASGGDDTHVNLYRANAGFSLNTQILTGHTQNIFSVKFMPHSSDRTLVTAAGDTQVRIFDIEYAPTTYASLSESPPPPASGAPLAPRSRLDLRPQRSPQPGKTHRIASRVYTSHACRAKRIVTENSPHLFLTCSEDGTVRQFDLRQLSEHYSRSARGARLTPLGILSDPDPEGDRNPPLISYRRHGIELNSISCSTSQPHYIALGGTHLYCYLHDRRMLGRDHLQEAGQTYSRIPVSEADQESLAGATMCVRRFAPKMCEGWERGVGDSQITACKISDANPSKVLVSWSADGVYMFDIHRSPHPNEPGVGREPFNPSPPANKRRNKRERAAGRGVQKRRPSHSPSPEPGHNPIPGARWRKTSHLVAELRAELFGLPSSNLSAAAAAATDLAVERKKSYGAAVALAHAVLTRINRSMRFLDERDVDTLESTALMWSPSAHRDNQARRSALARNRRRTRAFVVACGCVAKALGGFVEGIGIGAFGEISSSLGGATSFGYRFLNALVAFLNSGVQAVTERSELHYLESVELNDDDDLVSGGGGGGGDGSNSNQSPPPSKDEKLASYFRELERGAQPSPVLDFETNEELFESEIAMVRAFRQALEIDPSGAGDTAKAFWGGRVARSVLVREGEGVDRDLVDEAYYDEIDSDSDSDSDSGDEGWAAGDQDPDPDRPGEECNDDDDDDGDRDEDMASDSDSDGEFRYHLRRRQRRPIQSHAPVFEHTKVYRGHRNVHTIKDVNFFGLNDEYVVSGSDCGHLFIWDRETTELVQLLLGDDETVNVVTGHPQQPTLAVSGIDYTVKLFSPDKQLQSEFADSEIPAAQGGDSVTVSRRMFQDRHEIINRNAALHEMGGTGTGGVLAHLINSLGYVPEDLMEDGNCPLM